MKPYARLMFVIGILSLLAVFSATSASCWQAPAGPAPGAFGPPIQDLMVQGPQGPPMAAPPMAGPPMAGPPMAAPPVAGPPMGPPPGMGPCPPPTCGPGPMSMCAPPSCGPTFTVEGGARATLAVCDIEYVQERSQRIYFQRDLNFKDVLTVGEIYAAVRIAPRIAFTYSFVLPTEDKDVGGIEGDLQIGNVVFGAGSLLTWKTTTSAHRWEGEYFFLTGCDYRLGVYGLGELIVSDLDFESAAAQSDVSNTFFLLGFGGSGEYAFSENVFLKAKGAYTFLEDTKYGVYAEVSGRMFPTLDPGFQPEQACGSGGFLSGMRPYGEVGYRYRVIEWDLGNTPQGNKRTLFTQFHGPFAAIGAIF